MVYEAIADYLQLPYTEEILPSRIFVSGDENICFAHIRQVMVIGRDGISYLYIAPGERRIARLREHLKAAPQLRERIRICTPSVLKSILRQRHQRDLVMRAHAMTPQLFSAARVLDTPQALSSPWRSTHFWGVL